MQNVSMTFLDNITLEILTVTIIPW